MVCGSGKDKIVTWLKIYDSLLLCHHTVLLGVFKEEINSAGKLYDSSILYQNSQVISNAQWSGSPSKASMFIYKYDFQHQFFSGQNLVSKQPDKKKKP